MTVYDVKVRLAQLPPELLMELLMFVCEPRSWELVEGFDDLITENLEKIEEELQEYSNEDRTEEF